MASRSKSGDAPYVGLNPVTDPRYFFGRQRETAELLGYLADARDRGQRLIIVSGNSGTGKSSLLRAGLKQLLDADRNDTRFLAGWQRVLFSPGERQPLYKFVSEVLAGSSENGRTANDIYRRLGANAEGLHEEALHLMQDAPPEAQFLVVIDQFESLFRASPADQDEVQQIVQLLSAAAAHPDSRTVVIVGLRADQFGWFFDFDQLWELAKHAIVGLPEAMSRDDLLSVIRGPAQRAQLVFDPPDLPEQMLADLEDDYRGALPLLQVTLQALYNDPERPANQLRGAMYQTLNGVRGALAQHADAIYQELGERQQKLMRCLLLALTDEDSTRGTIIRPVDRASLNFAGYQPDEVDRIVDHLTDERRRLLILSGGDREGEPAQVAIVHQALVRHWNEFQSWIQGRTPQNKQAIEKLRRQAQVWQESDKQTGHLDERALIAAEESLPKVDPCVEDFELIQDYVASSQLHQEQHKRAEKQKRQRQMLGIGVIALVAGIIALVFSLLWGEANRQREIAEAARNREEVLALANASEALFEGGRPDEAIQRALEANGKPGYFPMAEDILSRVAYPPGTRQVYSGHAMPVNSIAVSPAGDRLLSGSGEATQPFGGQPLDYTVRLWDVQTGQELARLEGHSGAVNAVAFSPDGALALSASEDGTVRVWNLVTEIADSVFRDCGGPVNAIAFNPDGQLVLAGTAVGRLCWWAVKSGDRINAIDGHSEPISAVEFSPDGSQILSASADDTLKLWDTATGDPIRDFIGHAAAVNAVAFSPDGKFVLSGSADKTLRLWDVATGETHRIFAGHSDVVASVAFSSDGQLALSGGFDDTTIWWDVATGEELYRLQGHLGAVSSVAFSPDNRMAFSGSTDGTLRMWELQWGAELDRSILEENWIIGLAANPQNPTVYIGTEKLGVIEWVGPLSTTFEQQAPRFDEPSGVVFSLATSAAGETLLSGGTDGKALLWDTATGEVKNKFAEHGATATVQAVALSPDGHWALSGDQEGKLFLWDTENGATIACLKGHGNEITAIAFHPSDRWAASASPKRNLLQGDLFLWDLEALQESTDQGCPQEIQPARDFGANARLPHIRSLAYSPDGNNLVAGTGELQFGRLRPDATAGLILWEVDTGIVLWRSAGHTALVSSVAFDRGGLRVLSASHDGTVRVWDRRTGEELRRYEGFGGWIWNAVFSHGEQQIVAAGCADVDTSAFACRKGQVVVWRLDSIDELINWTRQKRYVPSTAQQ